MNWKLFLFIMVLLLIITVGYWINNKLAHQALVIFENGRWIIQAQSWEILTFTWPINVLVMLCSSVMTFLIFNKANFYVEKIKNKVELQEMKNQVIAEQKKAQEAEVIARAIFADDERELRRKEMALFKRENELISFEHMAEQQMKAADARVAQAEREVRQAKIKQERATFTLRRLKAKKAT